MAPREWPLPRAVCRRTPAAPAMDGLLTYEAWRKAMEVTDFHRLRQAQNSPLVPPQFPTTVRALWDDDCLYVGFECVSHDVWATKTRRDDSLWDEVVAEVFLDPLGRGESFFEFQVNPLGTIYDSFVSDARQAADWRRWCKWDCRDLRVAVAVDGRLNDRAHSDKGWSAVFAIPFAAIAAEVGVRPKAGDCWRANLCRYEWPAELPQPELSCWAPTVAVYDDLPRFGLLQFED